MSHQPLSLDIALMDLTTIPSLSASHTIQDWWNLVRQHPDEFNDYYVSRVCYYKEPFIGMGYKLRAHEFLVIDIFKRARIGAGHVTARLYVGRLAHPEQWLPGSLRAIEYCNVVASASLLDLEKKHPLFQLDYSESSVQLAFSEVLRLICMGSNRRPDSHILTNQSYWFANVIFDALRRIVPNNAVQEHVDPKAKKVSVFSGPHILTLGESDVTREVDELMKDFRRGTSDKGD